MTLKAHHVINACVSLRHSLKQRHSDLARVLESETPTPGTPAHALQQDLDALETVCMAVALGVEIDEDCAAHAEAVMIREGLLLPSSEGHHSQLAPEMETQNVSRPWLSFLERRLRDHRPKAHE